MSKAGQCEGCPRELTKDYIDKEVRKRKVEMGKGIVENGLWPRKLKTPMKTRFASKVIMFEEELEFKEALLCVMGGRKHLLCNKRFLRLRYGQLQKHSHLF